MIYYYLRYTIWAVVRVLVIRISGENLDILIDILWRTIS